MILKEAAGHDDDIAAIERVAAENPRIRDKAEAEIRRIRSGSSGEGSAAHFIDREFRDSTRTAILHDLRIDCRDGDFAQIDHLMLHRVQGTAWILETKNYSGDLSCDEHGDWVVFYNRRPVAVPSPIEQAKRQAIVLERWFKTNEIKGINRIVPVVLTRPSARVNRKHLRPDDHVVKSDNFARWFQEQTDAMGPAKALGLLGRYLVSGMDEMQLRLLGRKLTEAHQPAKFDWAARLGVAPSQVSPPTASGRTSARSAAPTAQPPAGNATEIRTPHGIVKINALDDGRFALRHASNQALSDAVSAACKGRGQWNPRYRNWIVRAEDLSAISASIQ